MSDEWAGWKRSVEESLVRERDAAEARYIREHRRNAFLVDILDGIERAIGDPQASRHRTESYDDLNARIEPYIGRYINTMAGDVTWYNQDFDFDEWERDYFGPRPETTSPDARTEES